MRSKTYLTLFLAMALTGFCSVAVVNYVVDPYRFFNSTDRPGINEYRQKFFYGQHVSKPYALRKLAPEAVILGVSRAGSSMATDHPGWNGAAVYNYSIAGSTAYLIWRNYQHAKASGELKQALLMLDFYMFNIHREQRPAAGVIPTYEERLAVTPEFKKNSGYPVRLFKDTLTSLISFEMLHESWNTVLAQSRIARNEIPKSTLTPTGFWITDPKPKAPQRAAFRQIEQQYMTFTWFPRPDQKFALHRADESSNLVYLQRILADAYSEGIEIKLGFMPFHARLAESMRAVDLWDDFEQWKKEVVQLVEKEAAKAGQSPFPLWEFSGYNSITTEPVPAKKDKTSRMRWHLDTSHVSRATGDLIQTVLLGVDGERVHDFGQKVDSRTIDAHLKRSSIDRKRYAKSFPKDLQEVREKAEKTSAWRK
jgi:hypothetical protein